VRANPTVVIPRRRILAAVLLVGLAALAGVVSAVGSPAHEAAAAGRTLGYGQAAANAEALTRLSAAAWGGRVTTSTGESVEIFISDSYPEDPALLQSWANYVGSLVHGSEISTVTIQLGTPADVESVCDEFALACYSPRLDTVVAPAEDIPGVPSAQAILAHEYGHHVANNRVNPPWQAVDWGTKRWATVENVCARTAAGELAPGDEGTNYDRNPGEGFAEAYRVLNQHRLGLAETPWQVVTTTLYPSSTALAALEQDVVRPWTKPTTRTLRGRFTSAGTRSRRTVLATPVDGNVVATLRAPARTRYVVELRLLPSGRVVRAASTGRAALVRAVACGTRSAAVRVTRTRGTGQYSVVVSTP
jgi:hypothetical protein